MFFGFAQSLAQPARLRRPQAFSGCSARWSAGSAAEGGATKGAAVDSDASADAADTVDRGSAKQSNALRGGHSRNVTLSAGAEVAAFSAADAASARCTGSAPSSAA